MVFLRTRNTSVASVRCYFVHILFPLLFLLLLLKLDDFADVKRSSIVLFVFLQFSLLPTFYRICYCFYELFLFQNRSTLISLARSEIFRFLTCLKCYGNCSCVLRSPRGKRSSRKFRKNCFVFNVLELSLNIVQITINRQV